MIPNDFFIFNSGNVPTIMPQCAILFHQAKGISEGTYSQDCLASLHDFVTDDKNESVIGAGRLLLKEDVESILRSILQIGGKTVSLLPGNVVSLSEHHIAWTVQVRVRPMLFNVAGIPMRKLSVPWPRLLIIANSSGKLAVAALKGRGRLSVKTKLYHAPLMNISLNGAVCTGSASLPNGCNVDDMAAWESVMFDTAFSHVNNPSTLLLESKNGVDTKAHFKFWQSLSRKKCEAFPNGYLVPLVSSLEAFIQEHAG